MRPIAKTVEPACVAEARRSNTDDFDAALGIGKQVVRKALVAEQGGLCCYCGGRIKPEAGAMKVEHLVPQSHPDFGIALRFVWTNLLGACLGAEGAPLREQHCDTRKRDRVTPLTPLSPHVSVGLKYLRDGRIDSDEPGMADALHEILGLNVVKLLNNRAAVIKSLERAAERGAAARSPDWFQRQLEKLTGPGVVELDAYVHVMEFWLRKRAARGR